MSNFDYLRNKVLPELLDIAMSKQYEKLRDKVEEYKSNLNKSEFISLQVMFSTTLVREDPSIYLWWQQRIEEESKKFWIEDAKEYCKELIDSLEARLAAQVNPIKERQDRFAREIELLKAERVVRHKQPTRYLR